MSFREEIAYPSFLASKKGAYRPNARFLPHELRYEYAVAALEECRLHQGHPLTQDQENRIRQIIHHDRKKFIAFETVGWLAFALNFATFVPLLIEAIQKKASSQSKNIIWIGFVDQILWLIYAIGIRSLPILILSLLLIPMFVTILVLVYQP